MPKYRLVKEENGNYPVLWYIEFRSFFTWCYVFGSTRHSRKEALMLLKNLRAGIPNKKTTVENE